MISGSGRTKRAPSVPYEGPLSVRKLQLDSSDPLALKRLEGIFGAGHHLERRFQKAAVSRLNTYWASPRRRKAGRQAWREELGLTQKAFQELAYSTMREAGWLGDHLTTAHATQLAIRVWQTVERHLFKGGGMPRVASLPEFTSVPGRGKEATLERTWATTRLYGTLDGHRAVFPSTHPGSAFSQPATMPVPKKPGRTWWDHHGALVVVIGNGKREGVFPVRLPSGHGQQAHLEHFLSNPSVWDQVTLVRVQDPKAPGGWAYWAHLLVHKGGYTSPAVSADRASAPRDRRAVVDGNVSVLAIASVPRDLTSEGADLSWEERRLTKEQKKAAAAAHETKVKLQRKLDVQRRKANTEQYELSKPQQAREERRAAAGLPAREVQVRKGPRVANKAGVPRQAYRKDVLTPNYRNIRGVLASAQRRAAQDKDRQARELAREVVQEFGPHFSTEAVSVSSWTRLWGKGVNAFTPGRLLAALKAECLASGGTYERFSTRTTALSQTCLCGAQEKKPLSQREHKCPACGFAWGRDLTSALVGLAVRTTTDAGGAIRHFVDPDELERLRSFVTTSSEAPVGLEAGQQDALGRSSAAPGPSWSNACSPHGEPLPAEDAPTPGTPDEPKEAAAPQLPACHAAEVGTAARSQVRSGPAQGPDGLEVLGQVLQCFLYVSNAEARS